MDARTRYLARSIETGNSAAAAKIGANAAHAIMRCGRNGHHVFRNIEAVKFAGFVDLWKTMFEKALIESGHVEKDTASAGSPHFCNNGTRNDVARSELRAFVVS